MRLLASALVTYRFKVRYKTLAFARVGSSLPVARMGSAVSRDVLSMSDNCSSHWSMYSQKSSDHSRKSTVF